jgi:hypothetical protein
MAETLCDWKKREIMERREELLELTRDPTFFCRKCARVANRPKVLCKPRRFYKKGEEPPPREAE